MVGFNFKSETPQVAVRGSKVPMLFIHGEKGQMVPVKFAHWLYDACGSKKDIYIVKNANHAESAACDMDAYFNKIKTFFEL